MILIKIFKIFITESNFSNLIIFTILNKRANFKTEKLFAVVYASTSLISQSTTIVKSKIFDFF